MREIEAYLAFWDIAREDDPLWREYQAWKALTERRQTLKDRLSAYTLHSP